MSQGNNRDGAGIMGRDDEGWRLLWTLEPFPEPQCIDPES
jgi:hypothetical protein